MLRNPHPLIVRYCLYNGVRVMYKEKLRFNKDGKFTILQVSDAQDMHIPRKAMFKMLNKTYDKVKPDLIVLTGDNILGNHIDDALFGNRKSAKTKDAMLKRMRKALGLLLDPIEKRKLPFAFIYGNHDDMNIISKKEQAEIYGEYDYCVPYNTDDDSVDCDTYNIPIYSSTDDNKMKYNIWMLDSAGSDENGNPTYGRVQPETIEWYERKSRQLRLENNGPVMSLMFQHIPVAETLSFFEKCNADDKGAIRFGEDTYLRLDPTKAKGYAFELEGNDEPDHGQLTAIKKCGDVCGLVFGHDHTNCFTGEIDGVNIIQTPGASFRSYGNMISRGTRVFVIDEKDPTVFETYTIGYFDLFGKKFSSVLGYIFSADEYEKVKALILALGGVIVVGLIVYILAIFNLFGF